MSAASGPVMAAGHSVLAGNRQQGQQTAYTYPNIHGMDGHHKGLRP